MIALAPRQPVASKPTGDEQTAPSCMAQPVTPAVMLAIVVVTGVYLLTRLCMLRALPIFFDEAHYTLSAVLIGRDPLHVSPFVEVAYWGVPPLFTWIAAPFTRLIADPLLASRLVSAGIGAIGLIGVWMCGRAIGGVRVAAIAIAFYVLCPFVLFYNRMALVDGLLAVIGAFALYAAMRLAREPHLRWALLLGACGAAAIYTKIFGPLDLALAGAAVVAAPPGQRRQVAQLAAIAVLIGCVAFLSLLIAPGGQSLLLVAEQQQRTSATLAAHMAGQLALILQAYGLYMTPPLLALALVGAYYARHERASRVVLIWALISWLPFIEVHLSARYLLSGAIPLILLAARGAAELVAAPRAYSRPQRLVPSQERFFEAQASIRPRSAHGLPSCDRSRRFAVWVLVSLVAVASTWQDIPIVVSPAHAMLVAGDRAQYVSGWPSGYAVERALADLRRLVRGQTATLISSIRNPPADDLAVLASHDAKLRLVFRDLSGLQRPGALDGYARPIFVVICRPVGQRIDTRRAGLRLAIAEPNSDGNGGVYIYERE